MTTWYAQNSSVNIDSVNQWNSAANGSGSWLTWASLAAGDILVANGKTSITINVNTTCALLTTLATGGTGGGGFILSPGITLTASVTAQTSTCITRSAGGADAAIIGNIDGTANTTGVPAVLNSSTGNITVTGNVSGTNGTNSPAVQNSSTGVITVIGNATAGSSSSGGGSGVSNTGAGTVYITGNCVGSSSSFSACHGVLNSSTGTVIVTGNCTGGSGSSSSSHGIMNNSTGTVTVTGNVTGGLSTTSFGILNVSTGRVNINGNICASAINSAIQNTAGGSFLVNGNAICDANGTQAMGRGIVLIPESAQVYHQYRSGTLLAVSTQRTLYTGGVNLNQPAVGDVRSGTVYGASNEYTGTCAVPGASSVAAGVPVDNTTGTAILTATTLRAALGMASADLDTQLSGISSKTTNLPSDPADQSDVETAITSATSGLASQASVDTLASYVDTEVAAIKAKTDNLPADPADASDIAASFASIAASIATLTGYVDTEVAAIKAKTDNLPADPADQSAVEAAITTAASLLATAAELAKVPKVGSTHRYTQVASDNNLKTADVSIGAVT